MSTFSKTMGAATVGGLLVYFLDPDTGKRRRALVKDRSESLVKDADRAIGKASRDLSNRARGAVAEARSRLSLRDVSDEVLVGRVCSFPHLVEVSARNGVIRLRGVALESEHDDFISAISSLRHVSSVRNEIKTYKSPRDIPGVQQGTTRRKEPAAGWTPAARLGMGVAGAGLALFAGARRGMKRPRHLKSDRHAAARQHQHNHILAVGISPQFLRKYSPRLSSI